MMHVYYRMTGIPSTNPPPILEDDKDKLNELCLSSFINAYSDVKPFVTFICDFCPPVYDAMIRTICPFDSEIIFTNHRINGTAVMQFEMARKSKAEIFLFQECDYLYANTIGKKIIKATEELDLVSPYDHANFYIDHTMHSEMVMMKLVHDVHYRSTERNTMTFAIRNDVFKLHADRFIRYGYLDDQIWKELRQNNIMMFVPVPSFATHMVKGWLAPSIQWEQIWTEIMGKTQI